MAANRMEMTIDLRNIRQIILQSQLMVKFRVLF